MAEWENGIGINTSTLKSDGISPNEGTPKFPAGWSMPFIDSDTTDFSKSKLKASSIKTKITLYVRSQSSSFYNDTNFYNLVFGTGLTYWLATRYNTCNTQQMSFGIHFVNKTSIDGYDMFFSSNKLRNNRVCAYITPVATIRANLKLTKLSNGTWNISN